MTIQFENHVTTRRMALSGSVKKSSGTKYSLPLSKAKGRFCRPARLMSLTRGEVFYGDASRQWWESSSIRNQRNPDGRYHAGVANHLYGGRTLLAAGHCCSSAEEHEARGCRSEDHQRIVSCNINSD